VSDVAWYAGQTLTPAYIRVAKRGRWHRVQGWRNGYSYQTVCGRVYLPDAVLTEARGERPGPLCGKCETP